MRSYFIGGCGALLAVSAVLQVSALAAGCNQPEETPYGNPNTLDRKNLPGGEAGVTVLSCGGGRDAGGASFDGGCPSFATDIYPYFLDRGKWKCSAAVCHGGSQAPLIAANTPAAALDGLRKSTVGGKPYIPTGDGGDARTATTLLCNLQGACGSKMPKAPGIDLTPEELCIVDTWVGCGSPP